MNDITNSGTSICGVQLLSRRSGSYIKKEQNETTVHVIDAVHWL